MTVVDNQKQLKAALQRIVQKYQNDVTFTQGAAEVLANHTTVRVTRASRKSQYGAQLKQAEITLHDVVKEIRSSADVGNSVDKKEMQSLIAERKFCGVSPWC